jgi:hypothetical protein
MVIASHSILSLTTTHEHAYSTLPSTYL